jgi:hypothetical protein
VMIKRLVGYNECRLRLLHQPGPIRASRVVTRSPLLEAQDDPQRSSLRYTGLSASDAGGGLRV